MEIMPTFFFLENLKQLHEDDKKELKNMYLPSVS